MVIAFLTDINEETGDITAYAVSYDGIACAELYSFPTDTSEESMKSYIENDLIQKGYQTSL